MKNNRMIYGICIIGMVLLVIAALFLPQLVFAMGDEYRLLHTQTSERSSMNISQVSSAYEKQMYARMHYLVTEDLNKFTITAMDYDMQEEDFSMLWEEIATQEWMERFNDYIGMALSNELYGGIPVHLNRCKKYIVYKEDVQDGIALMLWYLELDYQDTGTRIKLLVDSETTSIYYIKVTVDEAFVKSKSSALGISGEYIAEPEYLKQVLDNGWFHWEYYSDYYGVSTQQIIEFYEKQWVGNEIYTSYISAIAEENQGTFIFYLPYGEINSEFVFRINFENEKYLDISMGVSIIADLVPELLQN